MDKNIKYLTNHKHNIMNKNKKMKLIFLLIYITKLNKNKKI